MNVVVILCASIMSPHPGCVVERVPLVVAVSPMSCAIKAQEVIAGKRDRFYWGDVYVARYGCERRRLAEVR